MRYQTSIRDEWIVECTTAPGPKQQAQFFPGELVVTFVCMCVFVSLFVVGSYAPPVSFNP